MRDIFLIRSVQRLLDNDEQVRHVATMWRRGPKTYPFAAGAFVFSFLVASLLNVGTLGSQFAIGCAGVAVASMATTDQRILVGTTRGLVMMQSSRIRQSARSVIGRLPADATIKIVSDNLVISDWEVDGERFSMMRRSQKAMSALATTL